MNCEDVRQRVKARCAQCMVDIDIGVSEMFGRKFRIRAGCPLHEEIADEIIDERYVHWLIRDEKAVILEFFDGNGICPKYREVRLFEKEDAPQIVDIASLIWGCRDGETA